MYSKDDVSKVIFDFLSCIKSDGIKIESAYLFGSYSDMSANEYSDIDIALVSEQFTGLRIRDLDRMRKHLIKFVDLEVHTFNPDDFCPDNPFAKVILTNGVRIQ